MVGKPVRSEIVQQLLSDLLWKLDNRVKPSSLTYVIYLVESRIAHQTLRSAERGPTLSAACNLYLPFSIWREVFFLFYLLSFKTILFYFQMKVDGHVSRVNRDKCPVHTWIFI
jgi:hypothetical protein